MSPREITSSDKEWPPRLNELDPGDRPSKLFADGLPVATPTPAVAVVGSRRPTAAGIQVATEISRGLAEAGFAVVSGLAIGIDAAAHHAALSVGGYTIAVLGCGLDVRYPARNARLKSRILKCGTLLSEYGAGVEPQPFHFPERNRIIAGLSEAVVFVEGSRRSGGLITSRQALDYNRTVFAVPGSIRNPLAAGPNQLIRTSQATLVTDVQEILEDLAPGLVWRETDEGQTPLGQPLVNGTEGRVLLFLDDVPVPPDRICMDLQLSFGEVAMALAALEVRNFVINRPGGYAVTDAGARVRSRIPVDEEEGAVAT
jgi:DNA processing protein